MLAAHTSALQSTGGTTGSFMKCAVFSGEAQVMLVCKAFSRPPPLERLMRLLSKVLKF